MVGSPDFTWGWGALPESKDKNQAENEKKTESSGSSVSVKIASPPRAKKDEDHEEYPPPLPLFFVCSSFSRAIEFTLFQRNGIQVVEIRCRFFFSNVQITEKEECGRKEGTGLCDKAYAYPLNLLQFL